MGFIAVKAVGLLNGAVSHCQRDLPPPPPRSHTRWQLGVCRLCINRPGRLGRHSNQNSWDAGEDARIANWIWQLLLGEEHRHADWISDSGAGMRTGCSAAAAAAAGSASGRDGSRDSRDILRTTRIQLHPLSAPQTHHAHGEFNWEMCVIYWLSWFFFEDFSSKLRA